MEENGKYTLQVLNSKQYIPLFLVLWFARVFFFSCPPSTFVNAYVMKIWQYFWGFRWLNDSRVSAWSGDLWNIMIYPNFHPVVISRAWKLEIMSKTSKNIVIDKKEMWKSGEYKKLYWNLRLRVSDLRSICSKIEVRTIFDTERFLNLFLEVSQI